MLIGFGRRNPKLHRKAQSLKSWATRRFGFAGSRAARRICASVDSVLKLAAYPRNHANVCSAIDVFTSLRLQAADVQGSAWTPCTSLTFLKARHLALDSVHEHMPSYTSPANVELLGILVIQALMRIIM